MATAPIPSVTGGSARSQSSSDLFSTNDIRTGGMTYFGGSGGGVSTVAAAIIALTILGAVWLWKK